MSKLSLDAIEIVNIIKSSGSFSTAATILNKTPSAISYRVSSLEKRLGVKLFERNGPVITLTKYGEKLVDEGTWIIRAIEALEQNMRIRSATDSSFKIGVSESFPAGYFSEKITNFLETYQNVRLIIKKIQDGTEWNELHENNFNMILSNASCPPSLDLSFQLVQVNPIICCATQDYINKYQENNLSKDPTKRNASIIINNTNSGKNIEHNIHSLNIKNRIQVSDLSTQIELIKKGCGFGILPSITIEDEIKEGRLIAIDPRYNLGEELMWVAWSKYKYNKYHKWWISKLLNKKM